MHATLARLPGGATMASSPGQEEWTFDGKQAAALFEEYASKLKDPTTLALVSVALLVATARELGSPVLCH